MPERFMRGISLALLMAAGKLAGCRRSGPPPDAFFQTPFQEESQFIVENIVTDLAEQLYFARFNQPPTAT